MISANLSVHNKKKITETIPQILEAVQPSIENEFEGKQEDEDILAL